MPAERPAYCGLRATACLGARCRLWDKDLHFKGTVGSCGFNKAFTALGEIRDYLKSVKSSEEKGG